MSRLGEEAAPPVEDVRSARPYLLRRSPLETLARRVGEHRVLVAIDLTGLTIGLYAALALRSLVRDPPPILWNLLWDAGDRLAPVPDPAAPARLLAQPPLRAARAARGRRQDRAPRSCSSPRSRSPSRSAPSQHFTTFGLYLVAAICRRDADQPPPLELRDAHRLDDALVRRAPQGAARRGRRARSRICARRSARAEAASTTSSSATSLPRPRRRGDARATSGSTS